LAIIIILILIIILWPVLPQVLKAIWWAIKLPFQAIASWIRNSSNKPKNKPPKDIDSGGGNG
jgi:polyferredoxin